MSICLEQQSIFFFRTSTDILRSIADTLLVTYQLPYVTSLIGLGLYIFESLYRLH